jgi:hypothetical protein
MFAIDYWQKNSELRYRWNVKLLMHQVWQWSHKLKSPFLKDYFAKEKVVQLRAREWITWKFDC